MERRIPPFGPVADFAVLHPPYVFMLIASSMPNAPGRAPFGKRRVKWAILRPGLASVLP